VSRIPGNLGIKVECIKCGASLSAPTSDVRVAVAVWNKRHYPWAALGGKATSGRCSKKKRRASRKNLRKARVLRLTRLVVEQWRRLREPEHAKETAAIHAMLQEVDRDMAALEERAQKFPELHSWIASILIVTRRWCLWRGWRRRRCPDGGKGRRSPVGCFGRWGGCWASTGGPDTSQRVADGGGCAVGGNLARSRARVRDVAAGEIKSAFASTLLADLLRLYPLTLTHAQAPDAGAFGIVHSLRCGLRRDLGLQNVAGFVSGLRNAAESVSRLRVPLIL